MREQLLIIRQHNGNSLASIIAVIADRVVIDTVKRASLAIASSDVVVITTPAKTGTDGDIPILRDTNSGPKILCLIYRLL
jgi:predicted transcriptional regulator